MADSQQTGTWLDQVIDILERVPDDLDAAWLLDGMRLARANLVIDPIAGDVVDFARERPGLLPHELLAAIPVSPTTTFFTHLLRLEANTRLIPGCPGWRAVLLTDVPLALGPPVVVESSVLRSPRDYAHQFELLLTRGFPWINMCAAGVLRDTLLVEVEHAPVGHRGSNSCVNLSGPASAVRARPGWSLDHLIALQS